MARLSNFNPLGNNGHDGVPAQNTPASPYRILILEDNPDDVELMHHQLEEARVSFISRTTDKKNEFLNLVFEFRPDVILADYSLSTFNGMQAFQMLRTEGVTLPFILVTGALSEQLALECLNDGVDDFILKSSFKRLPAAINNAIKKKGVEKEKDRIAFELKKSHEEMGLLLERHQLSLEDERRTIARDLQNELAQVLVALKIDVTLLWRKLAPGKKLPAQVIHEEFTSITSFIDQVTESVKRIACGLRPETLDELGILEAIRGQAMEFERRNQINCQTFLHADSQKIDRDLSIALYRIVQEALTNVARHSQASQVEIFLDDIGNALFLGIKDNGKGIQEEQLKSSKSLGIIGLRERVRLLNGKFDIQSKQKEGTLVSVIIPNEGPAS
jgi:signal transduction histidine kinase